MVNSKIHIGEVESEKEYASILQSFAFSFLYGI